MKPPSIRRRSRKYILFGFYRLIRVPNLLIIALTQYMVRIFLIGPKSEWFHHLLEPSLFLLVLSTVFIAAAGYIINDYYDVKIDTINKPKRVVIGRMLRRRIAMGAHTVLNFLGLFIGLYLGFQLFVFNFMAGFLLWLYSNQLKRLPFIGNFAIALLTASSLVVLAVYYKQNEFLIYTYAVFAFSISLIREIIKDMEDVRGDANFGCKTLPIVWGLRRTKILLYILVVSFVLILLSLASYLNNQLIYYFLIFILIPLTWLIIRLVRADTKNEFGYLSKLCKFIMLIGILSMVWL